MNDKLKNFRKEFCKHKYSMFFFLFYFIFSLSLLALNLITNNIYNWIGIICSIGLILAYKKYFYNKNKINKLILILIFIIPLLFRFILLFFKYGNIESDYLSFLSNARQYSNGGTLDNGYISLFPFLYSYIALLGNIFKIFGEHYNICILMNLIIELIGALFFYLILRDKFNKSKALKGLLFYLYNPFSILWITKCCPVIVVNTLLIICFYCFSRINFKKNNFWIWCIVTGVLVGITNSFRPFMIIYLIAIVTFLIRQYKKVSVQKLLITFVLIFSSYSVINNLFFNVVQKEIGIEVNGSQSGFSLYVGSNMSSHGMWNKEDAVLFQEKVNELGGVFAHKEMTRLSFERYKNNGLNNIWFIGYKAGILGRNLNNYTYVEVSYSIMNSIFNLIKIIIKVSLSVYLYLLLIGNMIASKRCIEYYEEIDNYNYILIFGMGLFVAMLFLEVSPRYFIPITVPIMFTIPCGLSGRKK